MSLQKQIMDAMIIAMKAKDTVALDALRAVKSAIILAQTEGGAKGEISDVDEIKLLQRLVKQRNDSAAIYSQQGRDDLVQPEIEQAEIIKQFLPEQLNEEEVAKVVDEIIAQTGASSMKDMGRVMGMTNSKIAGKADGKTISTIVKARLSS